MRDVWISSFNTSVERENKYTLWMMYWNGSETLLSKSSNTRNINFQIMEFTEIIEIQK